MKRTNIRGQQVSYLFKNFRFYFEINKILNWSTHPSNQTFSFQLQFPINFPNCLLMVNFFLYFLGALVTGALFSYVGGVFLLLAFASPYWIESFDDTFSSFRNMGLWEYCFKDFMYPYYQFPRTFNGCHNVFSHV